MKQGPFLNENVSYEPFFLTIMVTDATSKDRRLFASDAFIKISSLVCIYLNVVFWLTVFLLLQTKYDVLLERCAEDGRHPHPRLVDPHCHHRLCHGRDRAKWLDPSQVYIQRDSRGEVGGTGRYFCPCWLRRGVEVWGGIGRYFFPCWPSGEGGVGGGQVDISTHVGRGGGGDVVGQVDISTHVGCGGVGNSSVSHVVRSRE